MTTPAPRPLEGAKPLSASSREDAAAEEVPPHAAKGLRIALLVLFSWNAMWWSVIGFFAAPSVPGGTWSIAALATLSALPLLPIRRILRGTLYPSAALRVGVLRPFWYVQFGLPLVTIPTLVVALVALPLGAARVAGAWTLAITITLYALAAVAGYVGSRRLVVREYVASFPDLPEAFVGVRIAQLSDLHVGPHTRASHLRRVAAAVREAAPDLIAHTGDQVDDHDLDVEHFARAVGHLDAPLGVYAVPGNHDVYAGWAGVREGLARMGAVVLVNDAVPVTRGGERIWIAGTGDPAASAWPFEGASEAIPDIEATLAEIPAGAFVIALAHNPKLWPALAKREVRLTLSGHTHHGQVSIPALGWCLASPFLEHAMGTHRLGASILHINPGTNYWGLPLRLGAWPEVTIITLARGPTEFGPATR